MPSKPMPDSPEANRLGCSCPSGKNGNGNQRGEGVVVDGIRERIIDRNCPVHSALAWWLP